MTSPTPKPINKYGRKSLPAWTGDRMRAAFGKRVGCVFCGAVPYQQHPTVRHMGRHWRTHIEHLTPVSRGGTNDDDNLTLACSSCNNKKKMKTLREFGYLSVPTLADPLAPVVRLELTIGKGATRF